MAAPLIAAGIIAGASLLGAGIQSYSQSKAAEAERDARESAAKDLLNRAGYTLSHSLKRDIVLEFFIKEKIYNLNNINAILDDMGEKVIGRK